MGVDGEVLVVMEVAELGGRCLLKLVGFDLVRPCGMFRAEMDDFSHSPFLEEELRRRMVWVEGRHTQSS